MLFITRSTHGDKMHTQQPLQDILVLIKNYKEHRQSIQELTKDKDLFAAIEECRSYAAEIINSIGIEELEGFLKNNSKL